MSDPKHHAEARRGIYLLPSLFTLGNILCGYYAVMASIRGHPGDFDAAAKAIGIAVLLDGLDGRIARMTNATSPFGKEFDSLADLVSFGLAPAVLAFCWGLRSLDINNPERIVHQVYLFGWTVGFAFLICGAWRLARFNIQSSPPAEITEQEDHAPRDFVGLPIPAAAGVVAAIVHARKNPITEWYWASLWVLLLCGLSYLMVSTLRYPSFKDIDLRRRRPSTVFVGLAVLAGSILAYSEVVLLLIATVYLVYGVAAKLGAMIRRLSHSHT